MFVKLSQGNFGLVDLPNWPDFVQVEVVNQDKEYYVNIAMENVEIKIETANGKTSNVFAINYGSDKTVSSSDTSAERIVRALISMGLIQWLGNGEDASQEHSFDKPVYVLTPALKAQIAVMEEWWRIERGGSFKPYDSNNADNLELAKIVVGISEAIFYSAEEAIAITMMQRFPSPFVVDNVGRDIGKKKVASFFEVVLDFIKRGIMRMTYENGKQVLHLTAEFRDHAMSLESTFVAPTTVNQNFEKTNPDTIQLARRAAGAIERSWLVSFETRVVRAALQVWPNAVNLSRFIMSVPERTEEDHELRPIVHGLERRGIIKTSHEMSRFSLTEEFYNLVKDLTGVQ